MSTTPTKLELTQINARLADENAALRAALSQAKADLVRVTEVASAMNKAHGPQADAHIPQWQIDRAEAMRTAREIAVATGKSVRV